MNEEEKLEGAVVALEGKALSFYQWENERRPVRSWDDLKQVLLRRFRSMVAGASLHAQWLALRQLGTVEEYISKYIELRAPLKGTQEEISIGQFVNGLKDELRNEVLVLDPKSLDHAMELALQVEGKITTRSIKKFGPNFTSHKSTLYLNPNTNPTPLTSTKITPAQSSYNQAHTNFQLPSPFAKYGPPSHPHNSTYTSSSINSPHPSPTQTTRRNSTFDGQGVAKSSGKGALF